MSAGARVRMFEASILCPGFLRHSILVLDEAPAKSEIGGRENLDRQKSCVSPGTDGHSGDRHTRRHLDNGQKRVKALQGLRLNRDPDDGQWCVARGHAWQMSRATRAGDDDPQSALVGSASVACHIHGSSMRRDNPVLEGDSELGAYLGGELHGGPIGVGAHNDTDEGLVGCGRLFHFPDFGNCSMDERIGVEGELVSVRFLIPGTVSPISQGPRVERRPVPA